MSKNAIVIGAGIVGLATTRALAVRGYKVTVIDREQKCVGASIRNFGMIWPIGQPDGDLYETALLSKSIWKEIAKEANIWHDEVGSLHIANNKEELEVLEQLSQVYKHRKYKFCGKNQTQDLSKYVASTNLMGSLFSGEEMIVDPRMAIEAIPKWLAEKYDVDFVWGKAITKIEYPKVYAANHSWEASEIYVCSGADFETLYPDLFATLPITKCKLQMMRLAALSSNARIGPALCGGLSLVHYNSFKSAEALQILKKKYELEFAEHLNLGIHVMVSQNEFGELTVGDSHEYGLTHTPFNTKNINELILNYLKTFTTLDTNTVTETWHGIYAKLTNGETNLVINPESGVKIINCVGGAGMTLSFGLCEKILQNS